MARQYLPVLKSRLEGLASRAPAFDLCIYNAGMDPHQGCPIGGLPGIDGAVLQDREATVFEWCREKRDSHRLLPRRGVPRPGTDPGGLTELHRLTLRRPGAGARALAPLDGSSERVATAQRAGGHLHPAPAGHPGDGLPGVLRDGDPLLLALPAGAHLRLAREEHLGHARRRGHRLEGRGDLATVATYSPASPKAAGSTTSMNTPAVRSPCPRSAGGAAAPAMLGSPSPIAARPPSRAAPRARP